tara:strand:+ start:719 stop:2092 length:1374 start_codon:yes stop_codon:yes gene_type:complete
MIEYDGISLSNSLQCTRICPPGGGATTLNCRTTAERHNALFLPSSAVEVVRHDEITARGWYSDSWLKGGNMMMRGVYWPKCRTTPCMDPSTNEWMADAPYAGASRSTTQSCRFSVFDSGKSAQYGSFGRLTQSVLNPGCLSGITSDGCWDCHSEGDLIATPNSKKFISPLDYSIRTASLDCIDLGDGKTAWQGVIGFHAPGVHGKRLYHDVGSLACCDFNQCECNSNGSLGCGRTGSEYWCFDREGGGVFNPCDALQAHDERCICNCSPWFIEGSVCFEPICSRNCTQDANCFCEQDNPGVYDGCAWGLGNGYDAGAGACCESYRDHFGKPYLNCFCPQHDSSYWCHGPNIGNFNNCTQASQLPSCHPECGNDPDYAGDCWEEKCIARWDSCGNPRVGWGRIVDTKSITINAPGLIDRDDIPWCYGCTAEEYFDLFTSGDYYAKGPGDKSVDIRVRS